MYHVLKLHQIKLVGTLNFCKFFFIFHSYTYIDHKYFKCKAKSFYNLLRYMNSYFYFQDIYCKCTNTYTDGQFMYEIDSHIIFLLSCNTTLSLGV